MNQSDIDLVSLIRMIARNELGSNTHAAWGYVANFYSATGTVDVKLPTYQDPISTLPLVLKNIPLGSPYVGAGYGLEIYPEVGTPCLVVVVETETGASVSACLNWNTAVPPKGGLQPGQFRVTSKSGAILLFDSNGNIVFNQGTKPVAVEGSQIDLTSLITAINMACTSVSGYAPITVPPALGAPTAAVATGQGSPHVLAPGAP
jgi:hypothetical protein